MKKQKQLQDNTFSKNSHTKFTYNMATLFEKHFAISDVQRNAETYVLPDPQSMFEEPPWQLEKLQTLKSDLNEVKSLLNNFNLNKWQQHTNQMNKAGYIVKAVKEKIQAELVTQAWCKFYEIASNFPLVPLNEICREIDSKNFRSVHLCEAPGAFVTALNHWLKTNAPDVQWNWLATTLNPHCEGNSYDSMVADDRFIRHTLKHWCFGADNTGDIMDLRNLDALVERSESLDGGRILLVTADGSIDCTNVPAEQESVVAQLHFCETVACLHLLQKGGNFLLKLFTLFEHQSVCLMYLLSCVFHEIKITKPASSKAGNSEMYVVCINFKGKNFVAPYLHIFRRYYGNVPPAKAMFSLRDIPNAFLKRIEKCSEFFKLHQCQVIQDNINTFRKNTKEYRDILSELLYIKQMISMKYLKDCKLEKMDPANEIVGREIIERNNSHFMNRKLHTNSYNDRSKRQEPQKRLLQIWNEAKEFESPSEKSFVWYLRELPESLEIQTGKSFNKVCSSRFCDSRIQQILNNIDNILQDIPYKIIRFPLTEITREFTQQIDPSHEILSFQFVQDYDSHQTITKIYDRLKKLQSEQTLILIGYSLLTQLNVGLLFLLGNFFNKIIVEVHDNEGYRIKLETYQRNEKLLNYLREILIASHNARNENMAIWSIIPITVLYECDQFPVMMQLNQLMIKMYARHVIHTIIDKKL
ncbi:cap-specific mRNA (nucleoside-2'-O-)-methyltransferase 2 isoform X1 [Pogonomyrmex barbatus]|uniref:Cap-specific mRNA (nucleoside-2'-O-)-methyltransferase 2 n=1 Tax=Pogonomyrmex barbatus TaxID=144034 RepID=A0A6I9WWF6_9HYME|nr:cap-specific mRNA (nucleoside-2'-O-)-methyltransferase 2 isoform X1 [Pogonomyrmex barbatus]XP_011647005.1 cap-specific mRNA (nucleoside-2'-O-)-methyltransferase 2 isoform X1 [Pogonomyrmex barbatus]XP_011647006.1 cap-specific mRNA (nucleoside-2'-O-)-methyltransferase 2 isoform X1 [Pogonomyrmex barbatus]XP_011647007.1 cap-specific mRNA (nucleoside-2'-O-)-methyltransferase 2 isoform X1 [Pogonomyrmex barbatus]XP_011647008.1 cap-specific mRNA (nucleoside-2'-O-)-methyltransferase 2 isoform X1 [Pog